MEGEKEKKKVHFSERERGSFSPAVEKPLSKETAVGGEGRTREGERKGSLYDQGEGGRYTSTREKKNFSRQRRHLLVKKVLGLRRGTNKNLRGEEADMPTSGKKDGVRGEAFEYVQKRENGRGLREQRKGKLSCVKREKRHTCQPITSYRRQQDSNEKKGRKESSLAETGRHAAFVRRKKPSGRLVWGRGGVKNSQA